MAKAMTKATPIAEERHVPLYAYAYHWTVTPTVSAVKKLVPHRTPKDVQLTLDDLAKEKANEAKQEVLEEGKKAIKVVDEALEEVKAQRKAEKAQRKAEGKTLPRRTVKGAKTAERKVVGYTGYGVKAAARGTVAGVKAVGHHVSSATKAVEEKKQ